MRRLEANSNEKPGASAPGGLGEQAGEGFPDQVRDYSPQASRVVYEGPLWRSFIEDVRAGKYPVVEGVVAKGLHSRRQRKGQAGQEVWMAKVKTRAWLEELARRAGASEDLRQEYEQNLREQQLPPVAQPPDAPEDGGLARGDG